MKKLRLTALVTLTALMASCGTAPVSLTAGLAVKPAVYSNVDSDPLADFSLELMKTCHNDGENTLISPLSVMFALGMTSEGADGETLAQFETLFGLDRESLGKTLNSLRATLEADTDGKVSLADSIWFRDHEFTVNRDFLEKNSELYGADIFEAPFDATTLRGINSWVKEKTDGMITDILNEIPEEAVMYLVNALAFDCKWEERYKSVDVRTADFTEADGGTAKVELMYSAENDYLTGDGFSGFVKYYKGRNYGFAAILPDEGKTTGDILDSLDGSKLHQLLANPVTDGVVHASLPKFEAEFETEMSEALISMGLTDAFDSDKAVFKGLGESPYGNIYINRVLHKTFIEVAEKGTRAGAATAVEMVDECALVVAKEYFVTLDRPFIYIIFETTDQTPLFIGTLETIDK